MRHYWYSDANQHVLITPRAGGFVALNSNIELAFLAMAAKPGTINRLNKPGRSAIVADCLTAATVRRALQTPDGGDVASRR
jgi:hypothetical protein